MSTLVNKRYPLQGVTIDLPSISWEYQSSAPGLRASAFSQATDEVHWKTLRDGCYALKKIYIYIYIDICIGSVGFYMYINHVS